MEHKITIISLDKRLSSKKLPAFRGAIATLFPDEDMYHNHNGDSLMYRYPLIQYKIIDGHICIVGIDGGASSIESHFQTGRKFTLAIHGEETEFTVSEKKTLYYTPESHDTADQYYFIRNWLPLNQENFHVYNNLDSISEKTMLLDSILSANILSLFRGFGYFSEHKSDAKIVEIVASRPVSYKEHQMLAFDIRFKCNATLPEFCGIGKGSSRGFGIIYKSHH